MKLKKRRKVLGVPVGRKRTSWTTLAILGAGAASTVATGLGALRKATEDGEDADGAAEESNGQSASAAQNGDGDGDSGEDRNVQTLRKIIRESIEVSVPKVVAYNQWTQFTELPSIVKGVDSVEQEDDDVVEWTAKIGPARRTWKARITEQVPDEKIAWESEEGPENRGVVSFHELDANLTLVVVEMEYFPTGPVERVGNLFLLARRRVRKDLRLFKHYIELAGEETGAWRGEIAPEEDGEGEDGQTEDGETEDSANAEDTEEEEAQD